jgi:hypothetical protein
MEISAYKEEITMVEMFKDMLSCYETIIKKEL